MSTFLRPLLSPRWRGGTLVNRRTGSIVASSLEAAVDSRSRRAGLLGRRSMPARSALLLAPCNAIHTCFMQFPIDVVFVARDGRVLKSVRRLGAWRVAMSVSAFATIELPAGALEQVDLARDDRLEILDAS